MANIKTDKRENDAHLIVGQSNPDIQMCVMKKLDGSGIQPALHGNLLLPIVIRSRDIISTVPENVTHNLPVLNKNKTDGASHSSASDYSDDGIRLMIQIANLNIMSLIHTLRM